MNDSPTLTWREVVDRNHSNFVDELTVTLDSAFAAERARAAAEVERVRLKTAESLNQILRRLRQAESVFAVFDLLADATSTYCDRVVVLAIEKNQDGQTEGEVVARRGIPEGELNFNCSDAAAILSSIESQDPVTALASESEISGALADALADCEGRVYLFPLVARQEVIAVLAASGNVTPAALEMLCGAADLKTGTLAAEALLSESREKKVSILKPLPGSELVQIAAPTLRAWNDLSVEDQKLHLQAQRMARVKVAEMRLYQPEQLREGVASGDIYAALHVEIDKARAAFLQAFLAKSSTMVDYLHLELLRSLAHDDDRLLGEDYPGPMV